MKLAPCSSTRKLTRLFGGLAVALAFSACGGGTPPPKVVDDVDSNCQANVDTARADLTFCEQGKQEACDNVTKDVAQVAKLKPKNQIAADGASKHAGGCLSKTDADPNCKPAADALANLDCKD